MHSVRNPLRLLVSLLAVTAAGCATTTATGPAAHYIGADAIDIKAVLPAPPADNSPAGRAELDRMLALQGSRTPEQVADIKAEGPLTPYMFATVLGASFKAKDLPGTDALLRRAGEDTKAIIDKAKGLWNRKRPWALDGRIEPCIAKPTDASYPSDRTCRTYVWAALLGELFPEKKDLLLAKARQVGENRVLAGVHYPSDVQAGATLGQAIATKMMKTRPFKTDLAAARAELAIGKSRQPSPP
jgi:acid phosphatase (class A)